MAAPGAVKTVYETTDGQTFEDPALAEDHQDLLNMRQEFRELLTATAPISSLQFTAVINWLVANQDMIQSIYEGTGDFEPLPPEEDPA